MASGIRAAVAACLFMSCLQGADWPMFRGPNASGIGGEKNLPDEFGPQKNLIWKTPLPAGHSSPVLIGDRIFLTGFDMDGLYTFALD
ncbi:MAG: pyrrolo-quinoline quinone, partial [Acidimicrobiia bacterium]|nr:pyrrolo-quinoline quinone [Acidimicrobiia bacterium]